MIAPKGDELGAMTHPIALLFTALRLRFIFTSNSCFLIIMRMIAKKGTYAEFEKMRQWILDNCPFALINDIYDKKNGVIYLYFWDSDYIPQDWDKYILRPTKVKSDLEGVSEEYSSDKQDDPHPLP